MSFHQRAAQESEVGSDIDLYNEEIPKIEAVLRALNSKVGSKQDAEGFHREIVERFQDIGLKVEADALVPTEPCKSCGGSGKAIPGSEIMCLNCRGAGDVNEGGHPEYVGFRIQIVGRMETHSMDWGKFAEQIQQDTLDLGEGGVEKGGPPSPAGGHDHQ